MPELQSQIGRVTVKIPMEERNRQVAIGDLRRSGPE
jgi:hypothetical protein